MFARKWWIHEWHGSISAKTSRRRTGRCCRISSRGEPPRSQAGCKTTLVRDLFGHGRFITLDEPAVLAAIDADPEGQLASLVQDLGQAPLIIDEAQRSKKLALAIKRVVDTDRRKGQFVLTGSSNLFTTTDVADSLAGRMRTLKLWPLSVAEIRSAPGEPLHGLGYAERPKTQSNCGSGASHTKRLYRSHSGRRVSGNKNSAAAVAAETLSRLHRRRG